MSEIQLTEAELGQMVQYWRDRANSLDDQLVGQSVVINRLRQQVAELSPSEDVDVPEE